MDLWIIAAIAAAVLIAGVAYLLLRREGPEDRAWEPRHEVPWDRTSEEPPGGTRLASVPPPAGVEFAEGQSEEINLVIETQEFLAIDDEEPTGPVPKINVRAGGRTDPGLKRSHNEDAFLVLPEHEVYVIADGMGGYAAGEVASQMVVDTVARVFEEGETRPAEEGYPRRGGELISAIQEANELIRAEARDDEKKSGMGTTVVCARFSPRRKRVYVAHVGDSRCYRIRDGVLAQLTADHTLGAVGITGPAAGKLSRAVGVFDHVDVDLSMDEPLPGDYYLLCSDGLYKMVTDDEIVRIVEEAEGVDDALDGLVAEAIERGGRDNVTVVLVRIDEPDIDPDESGEHRLPPH